MKTIGIPIAFAALLLLSCSPLMVESAAPESVPECLQRPATRAEIQEPQSDMSSRVHYFQTNHRIILMHHVELRDSVYVQTLTEEDLESLGITRDEKSFGEKYVNELNKLLKSEE